METSERARLIMNTLLQMEKQFGKGSVLQLGSRNALPVNVISTARFPSTPHSAWAEFHAAAWWRCSDRSPPAKRRSLSK